MPFADSAPSMTIFDLAARAKSEDLLLNDAAAMCRAALDADAIDILFFERDDAVLRASTLAPESAKRVRFKPTVGLASLVLRSQKRVIMKKRAATHPDHLKYPGFDEQDFESVVVEPLIWHDRVIGVMYVRRHTEWAPKKAELTKIEFMCRELMAAIAIFRNGYEIGLRGNRRLGAVTEVAEIMSRSPYLEEILQLLVNITAQQFNYKVVSVRLLDEANQELVLRATQATVKAYQRKRAIKLGESIAGRAIAEQRTIVVVDVQAEPDYIGHDLAVEQGLRSMICVPLMIQERPVGVLTCYTPTVRTFEADEVTALETIARQAAVSIEHAKLQVRNTLMQEMHHRVKNNLQQVVSLLRLQLRHSHYKSIAEAINDSLARILAIASVHDLLSREDLDHVDLKSIADSLVQHQLQSFIPPDKTINFEVRGDDVRLNMTQATQVALVINELIQNSVEHGFRSASTGQVHINIEADESQVGIWVSNDGDPLPDGFNQETSGHLGLQVVHNLARSLGGKYVIEDRLGWTVNEVVFTRHMSE
ncbi:MAG: GAF domain-containing protein [Chthonomonas sp.]|nr:GAF domain-containing protein [Chthonomonas sp.]